jgi:hypothetical protein
MLEDEHRSSMEEESLLSDKCYEYYVAKFLRSKRKKWKMKKYYEKKRKVRKKGRRREKRKRKKWEGTKIKLRKIIKMLLSSFCCISSQVTRWQIHTQIFQPCAIRWRKLHSCLGIINLPLAHVHLSKCVCSIPFSLSNIYFPWPFWRVSVIPIDLSLNLTIFRMYVLLGLFLTFQALHKPCTITYE